MQASEGYDYYDFKPAPASFLTDVAVGLASARKSLSPKYFYDERGSKLFDAICELPEYYLTRTELALLRTYGGEIAKRVGDRATVVEYGSGSGVKTAVLLQALQPSHYVAIDISATQLRDAVSRLARAFPGVRMVAVCADYTARVAIAELGIPQIARRVIFFPGSTIGNFSVPDARAFLRNARSVAGSGGAMLVGVDLKKDPSRLHAAYNDAAGVTAAFNLNLLARINRELDGNFDLSGYEHRAFYDGENGRIEMHLVSVREQQVTVAGRTFTFAPGETIHTESSHKYTIEEFQTLAREAGFSPVDCWVDSERLFSIHSLEVPD